MPGTPPCVTPPPSVSHLDCRCALILIVARHCMAFAANLRPRSMRVRVRSRAAQRADLDSTSGRGSSLVVDAFTRRLMAEVERDLGTRLDWIAVDHHNTGHPHSHVVIRGRDDAGKDLIIARDYLTRGMRERAQAVVTLELGPRADHEIEHMLRQEVKQERSGAAVRDPRAVRALLPVLRPAAIDAGSGCRARPWPGTFHHVHRPPRTPHRQRTRLRVRDRDPRHRQ